MRTAYLICYDISEPSRLARIYRLLKAEGVHLQYSVFLCHFTWPQLTRLKERLQGMINPLTDDIRVYPLPARDAIEALGCGDRSPGGTILFQNGRRSISK